MLPPAAGAAADPLRALDFCFSHVALVTCRWSGCCALTWTSLGSDVSVPLCVVEMVRWSKQDRSKGSRQVEFIQYIENAFTLRQMHVTSSES